MVTSSLRASLAVSVVALSVLVGAPTSGAAPRVCLVTTAVATGTGPWSSSVFTSADGAQWKQHAAPQDLSAVAAAPDRIERQRKRAQASRADEGFRPHHGNRPAVAPVLVDQRLGSRTGGAVEIQPVQRRGQLSGAGQQHVR